MRLTEKDDQGNWCLKGVRWEQLREGQVITKDVAERLYGALFKLKDYEDTGASPEMVERIVDIYSHYSVISPEPWKLEKQGTDWKGHYMERFEKIK